MYKGNKYKNPAGAYLLKALFWEETNDFSDKTDVLYTLKQDDHEGYPSIHRLYLEMEDAPEYDFAQKYFSNWTHWSRLTECNWFKPYLLEMRTELDVRLKARALQALRETAADKNNKNSYMANKFIIDQGLGLKKDSRGRPSKEKIRAEADKLFKTSDEVDEDFARIAQTQVN